MTPASRFGEPRKISPIDALKEELHRSAAWVALLESRQPSLTDLPLPRLLAKERTMLISAEHACERAKVSAEEIGAIKAAGAAARCPLRGGEQ